MVDNSLFATLFVALAGISIAAVALVSILVRNPLLVRSPTGYRVQ